MEEDRQCDMSPGFTEYKYQLLIYSNIVKKSKHMAMTTHINEYNQTI